MTRPAFTAPAAFLLLALAGLLCAGGLRAAAVTLTVDQVRFLGPDAADAQGMPLFRIGARLAFSQPVSGQIAAVSAGDVVVLENGRQKYLPAFDSYDRQMQHLGGERFTDAQVINIRCYVNWVAGRPYALAVTVKTADNLELTARADGATAPAGGALPACDRYQVLTVTNPSRFARSRWPVTLGVPIRGTPVDDPASYLYLVRYDARTGNAPVPLQVLDVVSPQYSPQLERFQADAKQPAAPPEETTRLYEICFPVDIAARGSNCYVLYYGAPAAPVTRATPEAPLAYAGDNPGITIDTGPVQFNVDPLSGSLLTFVPRFGASPMLYSFAQDRKKPIFYSPDTWAPPMYWGHVNAWDIGKPGPDCPQFTFRQGPLAYRSFRVGSMVRSNDTKTSVTCTYFAGMPFFYESSFMEFTHDTQVNAVRNNEVVFSRGQMTHAVWPDENGAIRTALLYDEKDKLKIFGKVAALRPDVPWLGMFNEKEGVGVCLVNLAYFTGCAGMAEQPPATWSEYYIADPGLWVRDKDHGDWGFTYMVRPMIYYNTVVPKGSFFNERSALLIFPLGKGRQRFDEMLRWITLLREPLAVDLKPANLPPG